MTDIDYSKLVAELNTADMFDKLEDRINMRITAALESTMGHAVDGKVKKPLPPLPKDKMDALAADFPPEAFSPHESKEYLSTLKAGWIIERLNQVLGTGRWTVDHAPMETDDPKLIMKQGRIRVLDYDVHIPMIYGGKEVMGKATNLIDAHKSAVTDIMSKSASYLGIGIQMFKGLINTSGGSRPSRSRGSGKAQGSGGPPRKNTSTKPASTAQIGMIKGLIKKDGVTQAAIDHTLGWLKGKHTSAEASELIRKLKDMIAAAPAPKPKAPPVPQEEQSQEPTAPTEAEAPQDPQLEAEIHMLVLAYMQALKIKKEDFAVKQLDGILNNKIGKVVAELSLEDIARLHKELEKIGDITPF